MKKKSKYFGKASQKLCVAGFVACACAAPLFQLEAVQEFMLNDVALLLIKRPLNDPGQWRKDFLIFSIVFFAAALVAFGCLYSLVTYSPLKARRGAIKRLFSLSYLRGAARSIRFKGYFKDTAQELKDFFRDKDVFNKRNGRVLLGIFAATFIGYFALIRSGVGFSDDIDRSMNGGFGWLFARRIVTEVINTIIHTGHTIYDVSPLGQVMAMGFLSLAAFIMAKIISGCSNAGGGQPA